MKRSGPEKSLTDLLKEVYGGNYSNFRSYLESHTNLDLSNQHLNAEKISLILEAIRGTNVNALNLARNEITDETAKVIAQSLRYIPLTDLNLAENWMGDIGIEAIANALPSTVTHLNLGGNQIGDKASKAIARAIRKTQLIDLNLNGGIGIKANSIETIARALPDSVTHLSLANIPIKDEGAKILAKELRNKAKLTFLDLSLNAIGDKGAADIAKALPENVTTIDFSSNKIGDKGAKTIAEALLRSNNLTTLKLGANEIRDEGAANIAKAFLSKQTTKIVLQFNLIQDEGANDFAKALSNARNPAFINLCLNDFTKKGIGIIEKSSGSHYVLASSKWGKNKP